MRPSHKEGHVEREHPDDSPAHHPSASLRRNRIPKSSPVGSASVRRRSALGRPLYWRPTISALIFHKRWAAAVS